MTQWEQLIQVAIQAATKARDGRVTALRAAKQAGQAERALRRLGIVSVIDIMREFPDPDLQP